MYFEVSRLGWVGWFDPHSASSRTFWEGTLNMFKQKKKQPSPRPSEGWDPGIKLIKPLRQPGNLWQPGFRSKAATLADIRKVTKRPFYTPPSWQAGVDAWGWNLDSPKGWEKCVCLVPILAEVLSYCSNRTAPDTSHSYPRGTKKCWDYIWG